MIFGLFALAIAPGVFLIIYFYLLDKYEPEPVRKVLVSFFLGFISAIIAVVLEILLESTILNMFSGFFVQIIKAFIVVGLVEESSKYFMVMVGPYKSSQFNEIMDGIVYTVAVSLGFATFENIFYVIKGGFSVGIMRAILSVPAHSFFAAIMGFYIGRAKFAYNKTQKYVFLFLAISLSSFFHGLYDYILFVKILYGLAIVPLLIFIYFILKRYILIAQIDSKRRVSKL
ncbi:MAG: PrsW family glutamic-type intramembrane protease [Exilispira sp.]|jgi:RsiW-degrading membrane proteinase PrsW (M82 family)|nr:PrsW family glutamic-type intramembrane protease [Exilispira sp.]